MPKDNPETEKNLKEQSSLQIIKKKKKKSFRSDWGRTDQTEKNLKS